MSSHRTRFRASARPPASPRPSRRFARAAALAGVAALVAAGACGGTDPFAVRAQFSTAATEFTLYPQSRVQAPAFSALELRSQTAVRPAIVAVPSANSVALAPNFDVAFDVDSAGRIVLLPPKLITAGQLVPRTGFQTSTTPYDSLAAAPGGTYQADSAFRVAVGQTVVVQAQGTACTTSSPYYAKLVIDAYNTATGALTIRTRVDPNCGFRSFATGVPTS